MSNNLEIAKMFFKSNPQGWALKNVRSMQGGLWAIEVKGYYRDEKGSVQEQYLFEVIGSDGTRNNEIASDLHQVVNDIIQTALVNN